MAVQDFFPLFFSTLLRLRLEERERVIDERTGLNVGNRLNGQGAPFPASF